MRTNILPLALIFLLGVSCVNKDNPGVKSGNDSLVIENIFPYQDLHCHGSSITELPDGDLLAVWFHGSGERTADDVAIIGSRRNHKTGKWCAPFLMADVPGFPDINPVVFIDKEEKLWLVWYTVLAYQWETSVLKYRISDNYLQKEGPPVWKWQDVIHVKPDGSVPDGIGSNDAFVRNLERKYAGYHDYLVSSGAILPDGKGIITEEMWKASLERYLDIARGTNLMRNGTDTNDAGEKVKTVLGYPLMRRIGWQTRNKPVFINNRMLLPLYSDGFDFSLIAITDDGGSTWSFSEPVVGAGSIQPALLIGKDKSVTALMRDNGPPPQRLMKSVSTDSGDTWSVVEDTEIPNPGSAADAIVLKSGNWIMVGNDLDDGRYRLSVWLSTDEGKTWPYRKRIVNGPQGSQVRAHYPSAIEGSDGRIHISFTNQIDNPSGQGNVKNIAHASFTEAWLMKSEN
jgi:predicted neuraminidase